MECFKNSTIGNTELHVISSRLGKIESRAVPGRGMDPVAKIHGAGDCSKIPSSTHMPDV